MIRLEIRKFTGDKAENLKIAKRLNKKITGAVQMGHCVLVDFDDVEEVSMEFAKILLPEINEDKVKIVGLLPSQKRQLGYA